MDIIWKVRGCLGSVKDFWTLKMFSGFCFRQTGADLWASHESAPFTSPSFEPEVKDPSNSNRVEVFCFFFSLFSSFFFSSSFFSFFFFFRVEVFKPALYFWDKVAWVRLVLVIQHTDAMVWKRKITNVGWPRWSAWGPIPFPVERLGSRWVLVPSWDSSSEP